MSFHSPRDHVAPEQIAQAFFISAHFVVAHERLGFERRAGGSKPGLDPREICAGRSSTGSRGVCAHGLRVRVMPGGRTLVGAEGEVWRNLIWRMPRYFALSKNDPLFV